MDLFKSKLMNRIAIWKTIGLFFWLIGFFVMPMVFTEADSMLKFALLFWYISIWWIIWLFGIMKKHPVLKFSMPFWLRWPFVWAWMNFVLALFMYDNLIWFMQNTFMEWFSPFWIVLEWLVFWLIVDYCATKCVWEGKKIVK